MALNACVGTHRDPCAHIGRQLPLPLAAAAQGDGETETAPSLVGPSDQNETTRSPSHRPSCWALASHPASHEHPWAGDGGTRLLGDQDSGPLSPLLLPPPRSSLWTQRALRLVSLGAGFWTDPINAEARRLPVNSGETSSRETLVFIPKEASPT